MIGIRAKMAMKRRPIGPRATKQMKRVTKMIGIRAKMMTRAMMTRAMKRTGMMIMKSDYV